MRNGEVNPLLESEPLHVSEAFLDKYNRPGPRYTSYPTAPVWSDDFGREDLEKVFTEADAASRPVSLYLHIPFCESLCLFCACNVVIQKNKEGAQSYLGSLQKEIDRVSQFVSRQRPVIQFQWGGGTPTYLSPAQMEDLFDHARKRFSFAEDSEVGIEVDPRVTTRQHLETARGLGFNRLSLGIQDFHPEVQKAVNRIQSFEMTRDTIKTARQLRFESINVDLIYGLPFQTAERFAGTVGQALALQPDRVAMFSYAHVPWLKKQQGSFQKHLPEGMQKFRIFQAGLQKFLEAGYVYIGMDHFARPTDELARAQENRTLHRNFQGYTTKAGADLYGMGVSAISSIGNAYAQNYRDLASYQARVARGGMATMRGYRLTRDDVVRRDVISRLLCHTVIPKAEVEREHSLRFEDYFAKELLLLREFSSDGLVALCPEEIRLTALGRVFIRNVAMVFDAYLGRDELNRQTLFSKTL